MSKKDIYRSYGIWVSLILFYIVFYYLSNHAWIDEIDLKHNRTNKSAQLQSMRMPSNGNSSGELPDADIDSDTHTIPPKSPLKSHRKKRSYNSQQQKFSANKIIINKAGQKDWESLYNIGPYRAGRIIHFRQALGGFYSVDQVGETYGLPDSVFQEIKSQLLVDSLYDRIKINQVTYDSLYPHPYITKQMAYFIVKHRESNQVFHGIEDLYTVIEQKDHERLRKLEPYLDYGIR